MESLVPRAAVLSGADLLSYFYLCTQLGASSPKQPFLSGHGEERSLMRQTRLRGRLLGADVTKMGNGEREAGIEKCEQRRELKMK